MAAANAAAGGGGGGAPQVRYVVPRSAATGLSKRLGASPYDAS
jgi:hypothetical protein